LREYWEVFSRGHALETADIALGDAAVRLGGLFNAGMVKREDIAGIIRNDFCNK
jgi:hypothetical protein